MEIKSEDCIEFLEQDEFIARKIVIVSDVFIETKGGAAHTCDRGYAKGNAYCYEVITLIPK